MIFNTALGNEYSVCRKSKQSLQIFQYCDERMVPFLLWWMGCKAMFWDAMSWVTEVLSHKWKTRNSHSVTVWCSCLGKSHNNNNNKTVVRCGYCKASSLLNVLWIYLGRPMGCFHETDKCWGTHLHGSVSPQERRWCATSASVESASRGNV